MSFFALENKLKKISIAYLENQNSTVELHKDSQTSLLCWLTKSSYNYAMALLLIIALALAFSTLFFYQSLESRIISSNHLVALGFMFFEDNNLICENK